MAAKTSISAQPARSGDNYERARAYEIAAYLSAASFPFELADGPPLNPLPSRDLTLNALVQHGVHRMDCDRAFLSLIDNRTQYICAEMTRDQSLGSPDLTQPLLLGTSRIALEWGVCPYTMAVFHGRPTQMPETPYIVADRSYFCIKDFRQVPLFADRPYVAGYPRMVSYIEIPLRSLSGHILGSYCVVDNKRRDFLDPRALATLREVTSAIGSYLNMKRVEGSRTRSERMMEGLHEFIGSERKVAPASDATEASGDGRSLFDLSVFRSALGTSLTSSENNVIEHNQLSGRSSGLTPQITPMDAPSSIAALSDTTFIASPRGSSSHALEGGLSSKGPHQQNPHHMSTQASNLFAAAANTIGHAMNLDGLVFFDAVPTMGYNTGDKSSQVEAHEDDPLTAPLSQYQIDHSVTRHLAHQPHQSLVRRLTVEYPQGHLFVIDEHGIFDSRSDQGADNPQRSHDDPVAYREWNDLLKCIPNARYAIFLPLWHYQREICFATCLAWVNDTAKTLDSGDVNSLTAFGNSIMAQIFRLEAATNTQSKSDFVSSISHELRSPLHGILATVELMQENVQEPDLMSMVDMIESCGNTLLDTFDHLLEFSNINSHANDVQFDEETVVKHHRSASVRTRKGAVDMRALVEDVVETSTLGHSSGIKMNRDLKPEQGDASLRREEAVVSQSVIVTTNIENNRDWVMPMEKGPWKRILLNIISNALKYTNSGHVDVALRMLQKTEVEPQYISLSVTDTGIGMSHEFLKYHLFTPFVQESNLSLGTGLGLSIVKSIVESLQGKIYIESCQHRGTRVTVNIPFDQERDPVDQSIISKPSLHQDQLQGLSVGLLSIAPTDVLNSQSALRIASPPKVLLQCVRSICEGQFGMLFTDASTDVPPHLEVLVIDTHALISANRLELDFRSTQFISQSKTRVVVLLGAPVRGIASLFGVEDAICVPSPITGRKIKAGLLSALSKAVLRETMSSTSISDSAEQLVPPQDYTKEVLSADGSGVSQEKCANVSSDNTSARITLHMRAEALQIARSPKNPLHQTMSTDSAMVYHFKRLLLVDDNPINLKILTAFAKRLGLPFSTATDGAEAVRLYCRAVLEEADPFDCIFMDISMPVMDGFQAVTAIRHFEAQESKDAHEANNDRTKTRTVPRSYVLALTGLGSSDARDSARASGFDEFLLKPVKFQHVSSLLGARSNI